MIDGFDIELARAIAALTIAFVLPPWLVCVVIDAALKSQPATSVHECSET